MDRQPARPPMFPPHARGWTPLTRRRRYERRFDLFPPHARGWTLAQADWSQIAARVAVSPARAGMDPGSTCRKLIRLGFPRTRGDGPWQKIPKQMLRAFPPHARGWTLAQSCPSLPSREGTFPPHARGWTADRRHDWSRIARSRFPRTRGDGPSSKFSPCVDQAFRFPPHARGWTRGWLSSTLLLRFPPHARGWTSLVERAAGEQVSPARAGMDPPTPAYTRLRVSPARAGMDPLVGAFARREAYPRPRTRGDGPWSTTRVIQVSPARAGMDLHAR